MTQLAPQQARRTIDGHEVERRTGYSRVQRWRKIRKGEFPEPVELGSNKMGWFEDEIDAWLSKRPRRSYSSSSDSAA